MKQRVRPLKVARTSPDDGTPGSRPVKLLQMVATRAVPATVLFYSARGIGSQASSGAAVDEEPRRVGKICYLHRACSFQASKSVGCRRGIPHAVCCFLSTGLELKLCCAICISRGLI